MGRHPKLEIGKRINSHTRFLILTLIVSILNEGKVSEKPMQWKLSYMDTLGTKIITVLISEVSLFQGKNSVYLYKAGTLSSVLINHMSIFQGVCILLYFHGSWIGTYTVGLYIASLNTCLIQWYT